MAGVHVKFNVSPEEFLSKLSRAVYNVALKHGLKASFVDVELDLHEALRGVLQENTRVCEKCGTDECRKAHRFKPFSTEARKIFPQDA